MFCEARSNNGKEGQIIEIALHSQKLNEGTIKRNAQMPNMEDLLSSISREISEGEAGEILATKLDFEYAHVQIKLDEETRILCTFTV